MDRLRIYLKIESRIFVSGLDVRCEERRDSSMICKFLSPKGIVGTFTDMRMRKTGE